MPNLPSPFVYWAQTEKEITLKVDLKDVKVGKFDLEIKLEISMKIFS